MFDTIRAAPGISPTSPQAARHDVSAFGSGTNENQFLFDGTNFTCPCNGVARAEPGIDFIQEVRSGRSGASAEFGNARARSSTSSPDREASASCTTPSYYGQPAGLTSQPVFSR